MTYNLRQTVVDETKSPSMAALHQNFHKDQIVATKIIEKSSKNTSFSRLLVNQAETHPSSNVFRKYPLGFVDTEPNHTTRAKGHIIQI